MNTHAGKLHRKSSKSFAGKSAMAITLLLYPNNGANYLRRMPDCDEEDTLDRYDQFQRHA
jgi:hypothetical protein